MHILHKNENLNKLNFIYSILFFSPCKRDWHHPISIQKSLWGGKQYKPSLHCHWRAPPTLQVDQPVIESERSRHPVYKIINAHKNDTGNYTCSVHNEINHTIYTDTKIVFIDIVGKNICLICVARVSTHTHTLWVSQA
jgi:hypothetical protein